jgi:hypothetical protein
MEPHRKVGGQGGALLFAVAMSLAITVVFGGMLYYTLKRYEIAQVRGAEQIEQAGREQQAVIASRLFAHAGSTVIRTDPAKLQVLLSDGLPARNLLDAAVVNQDDVIIAAADRTRVGQQMKDQKLASQRTAKREVVSSAVDAAGRQTLTVLEPLLDNEGVVAWAWLKFGWPVEGGSLRSPAERMVECARLMAPVFLLILVSIYLGMRSATRGIRKQLQALVASIVETPPPPGQPVELKKASTVIPDAGAHRAA